MVSPKHSSRFFLGWVFVAALSGPALGLLGRFHWAFEMFTHFRVQQILVLGLAFVVLVFGRCYKKAALCLLLAALLFISLFPYFWGRYLIFDAGNVKTGADHRLRILYSNVYTPNQNYERVLRLVETYYPDIVVLAEPDQNWVDAMKPLFSEYPFWRAVPRPDNFGLFMASRIPLKIQEQHLTPLKTPSFHADLKWGGENISLWAVHLAPPKNTKYIRMRNEEAQELSQKILKERKPTLVVGDLNLSPWSPWFKTVSGNGYLKDTRLGFGLRPTWPTLFPSLLRIPLDYVLHTDDFVVLRWQMLPAIGSDHMPFLVDLTLADRKN